MSSSVSSNSFIFTQISKRDQPNADVADDTAAVIEKCLKGIRAIERAWDNRDGTTSEAGSKLFIAAETNCNVCYIHISIYFN